MLIHLDKPKIVLNTDLGKWQYIFCFNGGFISILIFIDHQNFTSLPIVFLINFCWIWKVSPGIGT